MKPPSLTSLALAGCVLASCSDMPDFSDSVAGNAPFPSILPLGGILSQTDEGAGDFGTATLEVRAASLRNRAARLRNSIIIDAVTRKQMATTLARY